MASIPINSDTLLIDKKRHHDEGIKGSIVRLYMQDFMTYTKVELRAGPSINIILGPNGTGKSSIVCAICIALAGKPKILGRALSLKEYIRHDCKSAIVEIELLNTEGKNWTIKRQLIKTQTNKQGGEVVLSNWFINETTASHSEVDSLRLMLNIQIDNLCQFLPQDRVQEFSKMDSIALLRSTQLVAEASSSSLIKPQNMNSTTTATTHSLTEKQDELVNLNEQVKKLEISIKGASDTLRDEKQQNLRTENEVENFLQKQQLTKTVQELKGKKLWCQNVMLTAQATKAKQEWEALDRTRNSDKEKAVYLDRQLRHMRDKLLHLNKEIKICRNSTSNRTNSLKLLQKDEHERVQVAISKIKSDLQDIVNRKQDKHKNLQAASRNLSSLLQQYNDDKNNGVVVTDDDIKICNEELDKISNLLYKLRDDKTTIEQELKGIGERIRLWNNEKEKLENLRTARLTYLQREKKDVATAITFFSSQEILAKLKGKIHEPMILHASIVGDNDDDLKTYGKIVERHIGIQDLTAFFCEHKDDLEGMLELVKPMNLRISIIHHEAPPSSNWQRPSNNKLEDLKPFGFHKFLIDLIKITPYYKSYLVNKHRIQEIPIGKSPDTDNKFQEIIKKIPSLRCFYTKESCYFLKTSLYGEGTFSSIDFLPPARVFTTYNINVGEYEKLDQQVQEAEDTKTRLTIQLQEKTNEIGPLQNKHGEKKQYLAELNQKFKQSQQLRNKIKLAQKRNDELLGQDEEDEDDLVSLNRKAQKDIWATVEKFLTHLDQGVETTLSIATRSRRVTLLQRQATILQTRITTKASALEEIKEAVDRQIDQASAAEKRLKALEYESERTKQEAVNQTKMSEAPTEFLITEQHDNLIANLDREIWQAETQMQFLLETNPQIVQDYQHRKKKIEKLMIKQEELLSTLSDLKEKIATKKKDWLLPLQSLVDKINSNFETFLRNMQCHGRVCLCLDEKNENDFQKYGIRIMVKFRDSEPLAEIGGSQSGGERVITTALYILALQELCMAPFRVIDEINQGMDTKNETKFFNLLYYLSKGISTTDTPPIQYFIFSPKITPPAVDYPDNVKFHFIMNGPSIIKYVPNEQEEEEKEEEIIVS